jgi:hypothetical protein
MAVTTAKATGTATAIKPNPHGAMLPQRPRHRRHTIGRRAPTNSSDGYDRGKPSQHFSRG